MNTAIQQADLQSGDVLLFPVKGWGMLNPLMRLFLNWGHAAVYYTETKKGLPLIVESIGRGVLIRSLYCYEGVTIKVMRPLEEVAGEKAAKAAEHIADDPAAWYGYVDIPCFVLPKIVMARFGDHLPERIRVGLGWMEHAYRRNSVYICSELVDQAYRDAGYPLIIDNTIPLPDDLFRSEKLKEAGDLTVEVKK